MVNGASGRPLNIGTNCHTMPANKETERNGASHEDDFLLDPSLLDALVQDAHAGESGAGDVGEAVLSLSKGDIEALLNNEELGQAGAEKAMESEMILTPRPSPAVAERGDIDALIAGAPAASSSADQESAVSQEMIDALIMAASRDENAPPPKHVEPLQEPAKSPRPPKTEKKSEAAPDRQTAGAGTQEAGPQSLPEQAPITQRQGKLHRGVKRPRMPRMPRMPHIPRISLRGNRARAIASLGVTVLVTAATFAYLKAHQERTPAFEPVERIAALIPEPEVLSEPPPTGTGAVPPGSPGGLAPSLTGTQADKAFESLRADFLSLESNAAPSSIEAMHARLTDFILAVPSHPRLAEIYQWKAQLYEREQRIAMAREMYKIILARFQEIPNPDAVFLGAAKAAVALNQPSDAMRFARRLLDEYPGSPLAPEAELVLADAYAALDRTGDACTIWSRIVQADSASQTGKRAAERLGKTLIEQGRFADAVQLLEPLVNAAESAEGNEKRYWLLARAYRGVGRLEEARRRLNDILTFFGQSDVIPDAMVELSQTLDELGLRSDAVQIALDAAQRYPRNAAVLRNQGNLLAEEGNKREAAEALLAAQSAGMKDPNLLLDAARHYRAAEDLSKAEETYARLLLEFPRAPMALEAEIEWAEVMCARGQSAKGIQRLETLLASLSDGPKRLPVLFSMANVYQGLGLKTRTADIYRRIAGLSNEPEVLARAAAALFDAGAIDEGLAVADRVDRGKISEKTACELLMKQAAALEPANPQRAFDCVEKAYTDYPSQRTPAIERKLMAVYAARDNAAGADELLASIEAQVRETPADAPRLRHAAAIWADHLYDKKDYRGASDWYARAVGEETTRDPEAAWAAYQLGNSLLKLGDLAGSAAAFDRVAASGGEWARDAQIKAAYARITLRTRGQPVPPMASAPGGRR